MIAVRFRRPPARLAAGLAWMAVAVCAWGAPRVPAPRMVCDEPVLDLGRRPPGDDVVTHRFTLRNEGELTLEIREVRQYCGCTGIRVGSRFVAPGEETDLSATFSLQGRRGRVSQHIIVHTNDPDNPEFRLGFSGYVEPDVVFRPMGFLLGTIGRDEQISRSLEAVFSADRPGRIVSADIDSPWFGVRVEEVEPGHRYRIEIQTRPPLDGRSSSLRASVRVQTDVPGASEWRLPVVATRAEDIMTAPGELLLNAGEPAPAVRFISLRSGRRGRPFRIESVDVPPSVRAVVEDADRRGVRIRLDLTGPWADMDGKSVRIRTDQPGYEAIEIPFRVRYER